MCACEDGTRCRRCLEDEKRYDGPDPRQEREEELDGAGGSEPARRDPKEGLR